MLKDNELIVYDPESKKDVVATLVSYDIETGTVFSKIQSGNFVVSTSKDILKRNTPENIERVCLSK